MLAGGERDGSDAVTVTAADNAGIGRVDIVDVTDPAAARVVGSENYDVGLTYQTGEQRTDAGSTCSFRLPKPCPNLSRETVRPSSLQVGRRTLEVRVVDIGGNVVARGPYGVDVVTPSDRGAANGTNAKEPGRVVLRFSSTKKSRRTVSYGKKVAIRGRLLNADNEPIGGATVRLVTRDLRSGARPFDRRGIKTRSDGSFRVTVRARASRQLQFGWRARANDSAVRRQRLPDAPRPRRRHPEGSPEVRRRRPHALPARPVEGLPPRRRADRPAGQGPRRPALHDVRRRDDEPSRHLPRPLPLPDGGRPRAHLRVPRPHPPRPRLPVLNGLHARREGARPLSPDPPILAGPRHRGRSPR